MLSPTVAVVTNIDPEHLDHFGTIERVEEAFLSFINRVPFYGRAILCLDHPRVRALVAERSQALRYLRHQSGGRLGRDQHHRSTVSSPASTFAAAHELRTRRAADARPPLRAERAGGGDRGLRGRRIVRGGARSAGRVWRHSPPLRGRRRGVEHRGRRRLRPPSRGDPRDAARRARGLRTPPRRRVPTAPLHAHARSLQRFLDRLRRRGEAVSDRDLSRRGRTDRGHFGESLYQALRRRGHLDVEYRPTAKRSPRRCSKCFGPATCSSCSAPATSPKRATKSCSARASAVRGCGPYDDGCRSTTRIRVKQTPARRRASHGARRALRRARALREPLSRHTSFRIGGPADAWVDVESVGELSALFGARSARPASPCSSSAAAPTCSSPIAACAASSCISAAAFGSWTGGLGRAGDGPRGRGRTVQEARLRRRRAGLRRPRVRRGDSRLARWRPDHERGRLRWRDRARRRAPRGSSSRRAHRRAAARAACLRIPSARAPAGWVITGVRLRLERGDAAKWRRESRPPARSARRTNRSAFPTPVRSSRTRREPSRDVCSRKPTSRVSSAAARKCRSGMRTSSSTSGGATAEDVRSLMEEMGERVGRALGDPASAGSEARGGLVKGRFRRKRVAVVLGGMSAEREISQMTGESVARVLSERGYNVSVIRAERDFPRRLATARIDVVFNALHGRYGEDGCVQGLLEVMGIPYTGSGVLASAIGMDKIACKRVWQTLDLPTPEWRPVGPDRDDRRVRSRSRQAPAGGQAGGGGIERRGVDRARATEAPAGDHQGARVRSAEVLVERYVAGKNDGRHPRHACALRDGGRAPRAIFTATRSSIRPARSSSCFPAPLSKRAYDRVLELALEAHRASAPRATRGSISGSMRTRPRS